METNRPSFLRFPIRIMKALWLYIAGVLSLVVVYLLLVNVEQGIDVVTQAGEYVGPGIFAIVGLFFWAYILWFSSRMLSYIKQSKDDAIYGKKDLSGPSPLYEMYAIPTALHKHIPRLLAYNCFVVAQLAIFHLPNVAALPGWVLGLLILFHNLLYFLISEYLTKKSNRRPQTLFPDDIQTADKGQMANKRKKTVTLLTLILIIGYLSFLVYQIVDCGIDLRMKVFNLEPTRHEFWLRLGAIVLFGLEVLSVFYFTNRRKKIDSSRATGTFNGKTNKTRLFGAESIDSEFIKVERPFIRIFTMIAVIGFVIYLCAVFFIAWADRIGPLAFAVLAIGVIVAVSNFIVFFSIRIAVNLFVIIYLFAILVGNIYPERYNVRLKKSSTKFVFQKRPKIAEFLETWFASRIPRENPIKEDSSSLKKFPVYIVLSNGGASRAGRWASSVLSHLQDESYSKNPQNTFDRHILAIAGASGGSVGNCVFYSLLKEKQKNPSLNFTEHSDNFFESDFLTFTLARLLGPDLLRHVVPFPMDDRAAALERALENSYDSVINKYFRQNFSDVIDYSGRLPILYINSTQVDNGMPGVICSVMLPDGSQRQDVLKLVDRTWEKGLGDLNLSTAAILSSRFPYVSPAGKIFDRYFVDGGYFDNSGAGTVLELIQELSKFLNHPSHSYIKQRCSFQIIHISNSEVIPRPTEDIHPLTNDALAPVLTLAGIQGSSTSISTGMLKANFRLFTTDTINAIIEYNLYDKNFAKEKKSGVVETEKKREIRAAKKEQKKYEEGYPMSWVISDYQLVRMDTALRRYQEDEKKWFYFKQ